ncbi:MAG: hypothetical protein ACR2PY_03505 [Salinispira sp.]
MASRLLGRAGAERRPAPRLSNSRMGEQVRSTDQPPFQQQSHGRAGAERRPA